MSGSDDDSARISSSADGGSPVRCGSGSLSTKDLDYNQILILAKAFAYAMGIVILSAGIVILTITMAVLCFLFPDKANAFLVILGSPVVWLIVRNAFKMARIMKDAAEAKLEAKETRRLVEEHQSQCPPK
jgi:hypothetical protein